MNYINKNKNLRTEIFMCFRDAMMNMMRAEIVSLGFFSSPCDLQGKLIA
jgi:hypothetical protein